MSDNVLIAIIAACGVIVAAICVLGGAVFAYIANNKFVEMRFTSIDKHLDKIDGKLDRVDGDLKQFFNLVSEVRRKLGMEG